MYVSVHYKYENCTCLTTDSFQTYLKPVKWTCLKRHPLPPLINNVMARQHFSTQNNITKLQFFFCETQQGQDGQEVSVSEVISHLFPHKNRSVYILSVKTFFNALLIKLLKTLNFELKMYVLIVTMQFDALRLDVVLWRQRWKCICVVGS